MDERNFSTPGVDSFWEEADRMASPEHPLERELTDCVDAAARYWRLYAQAEESGRDEEAELLLRRYEAAQRRATRIRNAIRDSDGPRDPYGA